MRKTRPIPRKPAASPSPKGLRQDPQQGLNAAKKAIRAGDPQKADLICQKVLATDPTNTEAVHLRGVIALQMGNLDAAKALFERALALFPNNVDALNDLGMLLTSMAKPKDAIPLLMRAIHTKPDHFGAHFNLGNAFDDSGNPRAAETHYRIAIGYKPDYLPPYLKLTQILTNLARAEEGERLIREGIKHYPKSAAAYNRLGDALDRQGRLEEAMEAHKKALKLQPDNPNVHVSYARSLASFGKMDEAQAEFDTILARHPNLVSAHFQLSRIKKYRPGDPQVETMQALYESGDLTPTQRSTMGFALAKAYEDIKDYKTAVPFMIEANRLRRTQIDYSDAETERSFAAIKAAFTPEVMAKFENVGNPDPTPIFVVGMPRSGTTLTEQIIASHPDVVGVGETSILAAMEARWKAELEVETLAEAAAKTSPEFLAELGRAYVHQVRKYSADARFIVDKMPANYQHLGFIKLILPNAKIVHCRRGPADNCLSIYKLSFNKQAQAFGYDMTELGQFYRRYLDLMDYWQNLFPGWIFDSQYEELVADQEGKSRALLEHCGLDWREEVLDFHRSDRSVHTASIAQVRQPIYATSVGLSEKYGAGIAPLLDALGPELVGTGAAQAPADKTQDA